MENSKTEKVKKVIKSSGENFLNINLDYINSNYNYVVFNKDTYVTYLFDTQKGWTDSKVSGTLVRVNNALRIIREGYYDDVKDYLRSTKKKDYTFTL